MGDEKRIAEPNDDNEVTGSCVVTSEDEGAIATSLACALTFAVYGQIAASLGPALPSMSDSLDKTTSSLGVFFTVRGVGYFIGTISSALLLRYQDHLPSKEMMTCIGMAISGGMCMIVASSTSIPLLTCIFFVQGVGFGIVDTMGNCVLPEVWGRRVQPWMQAVHSCFGIGAIVGPALVGALGYQVAFRIVALCSLVPVTLLTVYKLFKSKACFRGSHEPLEGHEDAEAGKSSKAADSPPVAPNFIRLLVMFFYFVYVGAETGFAGWVPSYALDEHLTSSNSKAAYLSSIFWAALTAGRVVAVPTAIFFTASQMLRSMLFMIMVSCFLGLFLLHTSYTTACGMCGFIGFALSAVFPVMMTLFGDYGYAMYVLLSVFSCFPLVLAMAIPSRRICNACVFYFIFFLALMSIVNRVYAGMEQPLAC